MTATKFNAPALTEYVDQVALELYPKDVWEDAKGIDDQLGSSDYLDMLSEVFDVAFERRSELFEGAQWINSDYGFPIWVRPGTEWIPEE